MAVILVVDDDPNIVRLVSVHLGSEGHQVLSATNGMEALKLLEKEKCDAAVIDVMMPVMDGFQLTRRIKDEFDLPIILLTAKGQIEDKESGYQSGTDDYLVKPFEPKELLFRLQALLRRYDKETGAVIKAGNMTVSKKSYEVQIGSRTLILPLKEFELLYFLLSHPSQVLSREQLIEEIWGMDYEGDERTVDVHIKRLRERFSGLTHAFSIKTVRGIGYRLEIADK